MLTYHTHLNNLEGLTTAEMLERLDLLLLDDLLHPARMFRVFNKEIAHMASESRKKKREDGIPELVWNKVQWSKPAFTADDREDIARLVADSTVNPSEIIHTLVKQGTHLKFRLEGNAYHLSATFLVHVDGGVPRWHGTSSASTIFKASLLGVYRRIEIIRESESAGDSATLGFTLD